MSLQDAIEQELEDKIKQLEAELGTARKQLIEYEQTEATMCPEDVGIKEYVESLLDKLTTANEENKRLREIIWTGGVVFEDDLPSMSDAQFDFLFSLSKVDMVRIYPKHAVEYVCKQKTKPDRLAPLIAALEEITRTRAQICNCTPSGGVYACEIHCVIAEQALNPTTEDKESEHEEG